MRNKLILGFFIACLMTACSGDPMIHRELLKINMGMNSIQTAEIIDENSGSKLLSLNDSTVVKLNISNKKNNTYSVIFSKKMVFISKIYYIYAFENDKLIFWGTPLEFARHPYPIINQIGEEAAKLIPNLD